MDQLDDDTNDACSNCGGEGYIEMEFPVSSNAEEPDIRSMRCPECNDPGEPDPEDYWDREDTAVDYANGDHDER